MTSDVASVRSVPLTETVQSGFVARVEVTVIWGSDAAGNWAEVVRKPPAGARARAGSTNGCPAVYGVVMVIEPAPTATWIGWVSEQFEPGSEQAEAPVTVNGTCGDVDGA